MNKRKISKPYMNICHVKEKSQKYSSLLIQFSKGYTTFVDMKSFIDKEKLV